MAKIKQEKVAEVLALRDEAYRGFTQHRKDFEALEKAYMAQLDEGQRTSLRKRRKSSLTPMMLKPKVDTIKRDILRSFFGNSEFADIRPEENNPNEEQEEIAVTLKSELQDYIRNSRLYGKTKATIEQTLVYGTAGSKVYFSTEANTVKVEHCSLTELWYDRRAKNTHDIRYLVHRINSRTIGDLKKQFPRKKINWENEVGDSYDGETSSQDDSDSAIGDFRRVEIFEIYTFEKGDWFVTTLLGEEPLRWKVHLKDGLPFILATVDQQFVMINESAVRAYGAPFIAPAMTIQTEYIIRRNQQIDAIDMQLNQRFLSTTESGLRDADLNSTRKKITVKDLNQVKELPAPNINPSTFDTQLLNEEVDQTLGVPKYSQGLSSTENRSKTKGEAQLLEERGSMTSDDINRAFNENYFTPLINRVILLIYKYKRSPRFASVDRTKPLRQNVIINVGTGSTNRAVRLENIDRSIESLMGVITLALQTEQGDVAQSYFKAVDKLNIEKLKLLGHETIAGELEDAGTQREERNRANTEGGEFDTGEQGSVAPTIG